MIKPPRVTTLFGLLVVAVCVGYFVHYVIRNLDSMPSLDWTSVSVWGVFALAVILYGTGMVFLAVAWVALLRSLRAPMRMVPAIWAVCSTQIGKYLPSNVFHYVGRVALAKQMGCGYLVTAVSLALEILWVVGTGVLVVLAWVAYGGTPEVLAGYGVDRFAPLMLLAVALSMWPPLIKRAATLVGRRIPPLAPLAEAPLPGFSGLVACVALYALNYGLMGSMMYLLAGLFTEGTPALPIWGFVGLGGAAWLIGFVTPGSPGGLGVREALLVSFIGPYIGPGAAIGMTLAFRVATIATDGLLFLICAPLLARTMRSLDGQSSGNA